MGNEVQRAAAFVGDGLDAIWALLIAYSLSVLGAIALVVIGYVVADLVQRGVHAALGGILHLDETVRQFFATAARYGILILVLVMVLGQFGVQTASIVAAIGAAGLAIGLALQGTLQNIAAGIMLLVLRPFRVGESIETGNIQGIVVDVGLFATELKTSDGVYRLAPNSTLWNVPITNYSRRPTRRNEISVRIEATDDLARAQAKLMALAGRDKRVLRDPPPVVYVADFDAGGATITLRYWTSSSDWWISSRELTKAAKLAFGKQPEGIPDPQVSSHDAPGESGPPAPLGADEPGSVRT